MSIKICLRLHTETLDGTLPYPDQEVPIPFHINDVLIIDMGGEGIYTYALQDGLLVSKCQVPLYVDDLIELTIRMRRINILKSEGDPPKSKRWIVLAHTKKTQGLCACEDNREFEAGDFIQLWGGEILQLTQDGHLAPIARAWTPGLDQTPPQRSRPWENE